VCSALFADCTACSACAKELEPHVECLFEAFGLTCDFNCNG
jgi:hypothetical protein